MAEVSRRQKRLADGTLGPVRWRVRYVSPTGEERSKNFERKVDAERYA